MTKNIKENILGSSSTFSGVLSFLGNYQVCHNVCLGLISMLTVFGIAVTGMPLLFLTKVAIPFWIAAFILLTIIIFLKSKKIIHISDKIIMLNSGFIVAGIPFKEVQKFNYIFWVIGGVLVVFSIGWYFYDKFKKKK